MKSTILATLIAASLIAFPAFADKPNRTTQSYAEFLDASGCVIKSNASGQLNVYAKAGGNCPFSVTQAFIGNYSIATPGADGILGTVDDGQRSDN